MSRTLFLLSLVSAKLRGTNGDCDHNMNYFGHAVNMPGDAKLTLKKCNGSTLVCCVDRAQVDARVKLIYPVRLSLYTEINAKNK